MGFLLIVTVPWHPVLNMDHVLSLSTRYSCQESGVLLQPQVTSAAFRVVGRHHSCLALLLLLESLLTDVVLSPELIPPFRCL